MFPHTSGTVGQEKNYRIVGHDPKYHKEWLLQYNVGRQNSI